MSRPTNIKKQRVCEEYPIYLNIIYYFGNKVILMKQLFEYAQALGLAKSYPQFHGQITELIEADILTKGQFVAFGKKTQLQMLTLRKYALRFVEGKENSTQVSSVPKSNTNERIMLSIYKNTYILDKIIPVLQKQNIPVTYESIIDLLNAYKSNLLYSKNKGLEYLKTWDKEFLNSYFDINTVQFDIENLEKLNLKRENALLRGSKLSEGKGVGKQPSTDINSLQEGMELIEKQFEAEVKSELNNAVVPTKKLKKINSHNIDSMLNAYTYIAQMKPINGVFNITILIFDINNKQDVYKVSTQIASIYHMFFRYLKPGMPFLLKFGLIGLDAEAEINMKNQAYKTVKDRISKEPKGELLETTFKNWSISHAEQQQIKVLFSNYDITNRYLDGIKHANLMRK